MPSARRRRDRPRSRAAAVAVAGAGQLLAAASPVPAVSPGLAVALSARVPRAGLRLVLVPAEARRLLRPVEGEEAVAVGARFLRPLRVSDISTPAGTTAAAPQVTAASLGRRVLRFAEIVIPDGHVGVTGIAFRYGGVRVVPFSATEYIVSNADIVAVEVDLWLGSGSIDVLTYNTGIVAHRHLIRWRLEELAVAPAAVLRTIPLEELMPAEIAAIPPDLLRELPPPPPEEVPPPAPGEETALVTVPDLVGADLIVARGLVARAGLGWDLELASGPPPIRTVIRQSPEPGAVVEPGTTVTVWSSRGDLRVPPVPAGG